MLLVHSPVSAQDKDDEDGGYPIGLWGNLPYAKIGYGAWTAPRCRPSSRT